MRRVSTLVSWSVVIASLACVPRVSSEITLPPEPTSSAPAQPQVASEQFDVLRALDGAERILAVIDQTSDNPALAVEDGYDMESWLDSIGLRSLYFYGRAELSLYVLDDLFATPVYLSGPHGRDPKLDAADFGHYNLVFVERVAEVAWALARDPARVERTRPAFERRLRRQALTYLLVHRAIHRDPAWFEQFERDAIAAQGGANSTFVGFDDLRPMNQAFEDSGYAWYEADTAAYFWVRREQDGSASAWVVAIEALLTAYAVEIPPEPPGLPAGARP